MARTVTARASFSYFRESDDHSRIPDIGKDVWNPDTGKKPSQSEPERFYHGFVLGLIVELSGRYVITSNTVEEVLLQTNRQNYEELLLERGIPKERIRKYGFAFEG